MTKKKLLIVDDDQQNREILKEAFEDDYELEEAADGLEAMDKYRVFQPHIILLDIMMPNLNGQSVLSMIRQKEESQGIFIGKGAIPIIMLTAYKEQWINSFKNGCDVYVLKPFEASKLRAKVAEVLAVAYGEPTGS